MPFRSSARAVGWYATLSACFLGLLLLLRQTLWPRRTSPGPEHGFRPHSKPWGPPPPWDAEEKSVVDRWEFEYARDARNHGLSEAQCMAAFPLLYHEVDRAVAHRRKVGNITLDEVDVGWRGDGIVRAMIHDNELYVIDAHGVNDHNHRPRSIATLHALNRAVESYPGPLPDVEFTLTDHDSALLKPDGNQTTWAYSRLANQESLWLMPDFGFWGWPNVNMRSYAELQRVLNADEDDFADKIPKLVWRGALAVGASDIRHALLSHSDGQPWSDVQALDWSNETDIRSKLLDMSDHCAYMFVAQTEGNTYSGRLKYLLNCDSVVVSHELRWIEHFHHLLDHSGASSQNYVRLRRDFSDLPRAMTRLLDPDTLATTARRIADNARRTFRERYLTPAAEACYWRALIRGWASVQGFTPRAWIDLDEGAGGDAGGGGTPMNRRRPRGAPFAAYAIMEQTEWAVPAKARHMCIDD